MTNQQKKKKENVATRQNNSGKKRERPIQVRLPNGRTFILRYKRSTPIAITSHVELNRPYKQRSGPKNKPWQHPAAQQLGL